MDYKYFLERTDTNEWYTPFTPIWSNDPKLAYPWDSKKLVQDFIDMVAAGNKNNKEIGGVPIEMLIITEHEFVK